MPLHINFYSVFIGKSLSFLSSIAINTAVSGRLFEEETVSLFADVAESAVFTTAPVQFPIRRDRIVRFFIVYHGKSAANVTIQPLLSSSVTLPFIFHPILLSDFFRIDFGISPSHSHRNLFGIVQSCSLLIRS